MKKYLLLVAMVALAMPCMLFAADAPVALTDWLSQAFAVARDFMNSNLGLGLKISGLLVLLVSSMKVSILNDWVWSKLGNLQRWVAPILGLAAGLVSAYMTGKWDNVLLYVSAGVGATYLHDLLDMIKLIPGIGPLWVSVINFIEQWLGGPAASAGKSTAQKS